MMPFNFLELLDGLAFLRGMPATMIVLVAAFVTVVAWDLRLAVPALGVAYLFAGLLYVDVLDPRLSVVQVVIGVFVTFSLLVTARQVNWGRPPPGLTEDELRVLDYPAHRAMGPFRITDGSLLRLLLSAVVMMGVLWAARDATSLLPTIPPDLAHLELAILGLGGLGLVGLATSDEAMRSGLGLLILLIGFGLFYSSFDQTMPMIIALAAMHPIVATAIAYLAQAGYLPADVANQDG